MTPYYYDLFKYLKRADIYPYQLYLQTLTRHVLTIDNRRIVNVKKDVKCNIRNFPCKHSGRRME